VGTKKGPDTGGIAEKTLEKIWGRCKVGGVVDEGACKAGKLSSRVKPLEEVATHQPSSKHQKNGGKKGVPGKEGVKNDKRFQKDQVNDGGKSQPKLAENRKLSGYQRKGGKSMGRKG